MDKGPRLMPPVACFSWTWNMIWVIEGCFNPFAHKMRATERCPWTDQSGSVGWPRWQDLKPCMKETDNSSSFAKNSLARALAKLRGRLFAFRHKHDHRVCVSTVKLKRSTLVCFYWVTKRMSQYFSQTIFLKLKFYGKSKAMEIDAAIVEFECESRFIAPHHCSPLFLAPIGVFLTPLLPNNFDGRFTTVFWLLGGKNVMYSHLCQTLRGTYAASDFWYRPSSNSQLGNRLKYVSITG